MNVKANISLLFAIFFWFNEAVSVQRDVFLTAGKNDWSVPAWFAVWIHAPRHTGVFCSAVNMTWEEIKWCTLITYFGKNIFHSYTLLAEKVN